MLSVASGRMGSHFDGEDVGARLLNLVSGYVLVVTFVITGILTVTYLAMLGVMLSYIRKHQPALYKAMGEPSMFIRNSIGSSRRVVRFILDKDYLEPGDPRLARLGGRIRLLFQCLIGLNVVMFTSFFVVQFTF